MRKCGTRSSEGSATLLDDLPSEVATAAQSLLSRQEMRVLACRLMGLTYKETASRLDIQECTVREYLRRIYRKTNSRSTLEAFCKLRKRAGGPVS